MLATALVSPTVHHRHAPMARVPRRAPLQGGFDTRYRWTEDGYHIEEVATGRVFRRDLWATRGR